MLDSNALNDLLDRVGGDAEFFAELIDTFLEDAPRLLADMRAAAERGNAEALRLAAHSLKSNAADFGAMQLSALCRELEHLGKSGVTDGAASLVARAETAFARVRPALEAARGGG